MSEKKVVMDFAADTYVSFYGAPVNSKVFNHIFEQVASLAPETLAFLKKRLTTKSAHLPESEMRLTPRMQKFLENKGLTDISGSFHDVAATIIRGMDPATNTGMRPEDYIRPAIVEPAADF
ncbi:MAG TPA: hypothetical protein VIG74_02985 [Alphaproteobacteria bacterium]